MRATIIIEFKVGGGRGGSVCVCEEMSILFLKIGFYQYTHHSLTQNLFRHRIRCLCKKKRSLLCMCEEMIIFFFLWVQYSIVLLPTRSLTQQTYLEELIACGKKKCFYEVTIGFLNRLQEIYCKTSPSCSERILRGEPAQLSFIPLDAQM